MVKDSKKLKIMTIFGTRPEIIRLSRVFVTLDKYVNHIMVHTGQSYDYEMNQIFFADLKVREPDYFLGVKADTIGGQIANIIAKTEEVLLKEKPDAVLILGDTNSALSAIIARRMKIPIFHMEAGNRSFDENVPEETNRRIVDHISDINMPYSENARHYLVREGVHPGTIYVTGSPLAEVFDCYKKSIDKSQVLKELKLSSGKYFVASIHREENVDDKESLSEIMDALNSLAEIYKFPIIMSTHPRTAKRLEEYKLKPSTLINFHKPLGYFDYNKLQKNSLCVLSDSGSIQEESSMMDFPAIQVRVSSERPEAFDEGVLILSGRSKSIVLQAVEVTIKQRAAGEKFNIPQSYRDTNISGKVLRLIVGLTKIVQKRRGFRK
ncbi:MAG: UDP-N-acetylglucosamine 2-epimerase (non-hydrolyzing) [Candidatus Liptonbacteria bacterium]|nr:UDP-N-acetylglucosamine 2-epimerase (non-hydrolyzing) [Candidatus Liptonbacteria bacterium]